jgi:hypothetical protein
MKSKYFTLFFLFVIFVTQMTIQAQYAQRQDAIWARMVPAGTITMDGILDEPAWSLADSFKVNYGQLGPLPTSGWRAEQNPDGVTDPTHATVKFLVSDDNQLWLGFTIPDSSVGGDNGWPTWDGILASIRTLGDDSMAYAAELFYTYWAAGNKNPDTVIVGGGPYFISGNTNGLFTNDWGNVDSTRTPDRINNWDAKTVVLGGQSNDAGRDKGWVVEMRINLSALGYNVTQTDGDVVPYSFSIWDCDYLFEGNPTKVSATRTHIQSPWGNANANNVIRIYARPDIGLTSALPTAAPDVVIPNGAAYPDPVIDGVPNEDVWKGAYSFDLGWDIVNLRKNYPGVGKILSARYQPELTTGVTPPILDPSFAHIKMFFKDHYLYFAADVVDGRVQGTNIFDKIDGVRLIIGDRSKINDDNNMVFQMLRVNFNSSGVATPYEYMTTLVDSGKAQFAAALTGVTTMNDNTDFDEGYSIEMKIDLTGLGYPMDLGDKLIFTGVMLADGDSFDDPLANYGTRVWWFREHDGGPAATWSVLDTNTPVGVENEKVSFVPGSIELYGNYPNPFNPSTTIKFSIPETGDVSIRIFNTLGQEIRSTDLVGRNSGELNYSFDASQISSGVYFYKITLNNSTSGKNYPSKVGKMMLLK